MENLPEIIRRHLVLMVIWFIPLGVFSQQEFIVYKVKGEPYLKINDSVQSVTKGSVIDEAATLIMKRDDELHYIDSKGDIYELYETGSFNYQALQKRTAFKENTSFMRNLFSYVWKELTYNMASRNNKSGVVYRGDALVLMRYPADSISIYSNNIRFEWEPIENKEKDYFFILREVNGDTKTVIGTPSTSLALTTDNILLRKGHDYEWTISETKYPDSKTRYYSFKLGTDDDFKTKAADIKQISLTLKKLGFTKAEIREAICQDYKICY
ncbi:MAG: hypothetical protein HKN96_13825 [Flavobacteriaceae bacterium]|nr:hypothetical protein [Flavobacteriaceae bacterium]